MFRWQGTHLVVMPSLIVYGLIGPFPRFGTLSVQLGNWKKVTSQALLHSMKAIGRNSSSQWAFAVLLAVCMIFWMRIAALLHALYPSVQGAPITDFLPFLVIGSLVGFS